MKSLILTLITLSSAIAFSADCPSPMLKVLNCLSAPAPGDHEAVSGMLDSIVICQEGNSTSAVFQSGTSVDITDAKVTNRVGGTDYDMSAKDSEATLSVVTGVRKNQDLQATFTLKLGDIEPMSSTFICER